MGKSSKAERALADRATAAGLGVSADEFKHVRAQLGRAESGLAALSKGERQQRTARRLKISVEELKSLRQALAGQPPAPRARLAARQIAGLPDLSIAPVPTTRQLGTPSVVRRGAPGISATSRVFITPEGDVVHIERDCHGTRGFRRVREPDPKVTPALLRDAACRDRRACLICCEGAASRYDTELNRLHGLRGARLGGRAPSGQAASRGHGQVTRTSSKRNKAKRRGRPVVPTPKRKKGTGYWVWASS